MNVLRLVAIFVSISLLFVAANVQAQVPPRAEQPHQDVFDCGVGNCQTLNPVTRKAKAERASNYRVLLMPGCVAGSIPQDLEAMNREAEKVGFRLSRNDTAYDFTVRINCGTEQARICGAVTIFCLNRGFPYTPDVEISDILSSYPATTRLSILLHEILAHAVSTWNEQYCVGYETAGICLGLTRFTPAPGWVDFMNTGANSRHGIEVIERERWERTMYVLVQENPQWTGSEWRFDPLYLGYLRSLRLDTPDGTWHDDSGRLVWGDVDPSWMGRWNALMQCWVGPESMLCSGLWIAAKVPLP